MSLPAPPPSPQAEPPGAATPRVSWTSRNTLTAWLVLAVALTATLYSWNYARDLAEQQAQTQFDNMTDDVRDQLERNMNVYAQVLHASAAFFNAAEMTNPAEWRDFVIGLALERNFPEIDSVGFAREVRSKEKTAYELQMRAEGLADYRISPPGEREVYAPIVYLEPSTEGRLRLLGRDMYAEPFRRAAMENARDKGGTALTDKLTLQLVRSGERPPGFVIYAPVYRRGTSPVTLEERRVALIGWVFAPLRITKFMTTLLGVHNHPLSLKILEIDKAGEERLIFDNGSGSNIAGARQSWTRQVMLPVAGREWQLRFSPAASYTHLSDNTPQLILLGGIVISVLLFAVVMVLATMRVRAQALADRLTHELRLSNDQLESRVAERTAELQTVLTASPMPIAHVVGGRFRWISSAVEAMTGYRAMDLIGQSTQMLFANEEEFDAGQQAILPTVAAGGVRRIQQTLVTRDGRRLDCEGYIKALDPADPARGTVSILLDVTERRRGEEALRESEHFNRLLFQSSPIGLALCRMDGSLVDINPAYANILGRSTDEALGLTYWEITPDRYARDEADQLHSLLTTSRYGPYEKEYIHSDGHLVPVRLVGRIIERSGERFILSAAEDITQSKAAALEIDEYVARIELQNARLAESDRVKTDFLNNVSHELKTPLNAIIGFSELLAEGIPQALDPQQAEYAQEIMDAGKHLLNLINDILMYSRSEAGQLKLHPETVAVAPFMERRLKGFEDAAAKKKIELTLSIASDCTIFLADREYLRTIIDQLLSNAIKFTPRGGHVSLSAALVDRDDRSADPAREGSTSGNVHARQIEIIISDSGIGIAPEDMERLFQPFTQVDGKLTRRAGGTGIGLALIQRLVEVHDGTLIVDSAPGCGSRFTVRLPWGDAEDMKDPPA